jgi:hypothetical protein
MQTGNKRGVNILIKSSGKRTSMLHLWKHECGAEMVGSLALILSIIALLAAISLALNAHGADAGQAITAALVNMLTGVTHTAPVDLKHPPLTGPALNIMTLSVTGVPSLLGSIAPVSAGPMYLAAVSALAGSVLMLARGTGRGILVSWMTMRFVFPHLRLSVMARTGIQIVNHAARAIPRPLQGPLAVWTRAGRIFHIDYGRLRGFPGKVWHLNVDTGWRWLRNLNHTPLPNWVSALRPGTRTFRWIGRVSKALVVVAIVADVFDLGTAIRADADAGRGWWGPETRAAVGRVAGGWGGAAAGAAAGTLLFPGIGTVIGAIVGGIGGSFLLERVLRGNE